MTEDTAISSTEEPIPDTGQKPAPKKSSGRRSSKVKQLMQRITELESQTADLQSENQVLQDKTLRAMAQRLAPSSS